MLTPSPRPRGVHQLHSKQTFLPNTSSEFPNLLRASRNWEELLSSDRATSSRLCPCPYLSKGPFPGLRLLIPGCSLRQKVQGSQSTSVWGETGQALLHVNSQLFWHHYAKSFYIRPQKHTANKIKNIRMALYQTETFLHSERSDRLTGLGRCKNVCPAS